MKIKPQEHCCICGCTVHRKGGYAAPTVQGRSHATKHHYVAERFYGRSTNRRGDQRVPLFPECPWSVEGQTAVFCYDCHELLLHNPVFLPTDLERFAELVRARGLDEPEKTEGTDKLAGRIKLLQEVISKGLEACNNDMHRPTGE
jgi:hypothetical protein